ncbi:MAG: hypothetical protein AMS25_03100 [Gemmatimonas sp. SM23_52]|nr:MAG: hypothetical protein AMS25_03100 [Gemmatimonas sp. SM23_52]
MARQEFGCKNCGSVIKLDSWAGSNNLTMNVEGGRFEEKWGEGIVIVCSNCSQVVAQLNLER